MAEDPDRIREEIADTRERLGEAAEALAYKSDVRSRARDRATETRRAVEGRVRALGDLDTLRQSGPWRTVQDRVSTVQERVKGLRDGGGGDGGGGGAAGSLRERLPQATIAALAGGLLIGLLVPLRRARRRSRRS
jgi:Protein of unknown function (DUF3618)